MVLDRVVLGGQTERVPADGIQDVVALQTALAGYGIQRGIGTGMSDVESLTRGIRELDQRIELRLVRIGLGMENALVLPDFLPLRLDCLVVVFHIDSSKRLDTA